MFYDIYIELCKRDGKKPSPVATELGIRTSNVAQWKKGSTPRPDVLSKIADYFNVSVSYLLGNEQKNPPVISDEGNRTWAKSVIDQMTDADFDALAPMLKMLGDKYKGH